ncbi:hypothetical protein CYMTET_41141 [Cymbomonas tetramitiformis]|nr:hypothetical protein CYMTET_41141 [Cymbomonas tetramitiformis]
MIDRSKITNLRPRTLKDKPDFHALIRAGRHFTDLSEEDYDAMCREVYGVYLGAISQIDSLFGTLMTALDASPLKDSTSVFVFSDHGDYAGDYGLIEKWPSGMEDVLTRVPLLCAVPSLVLLCALYHMTSSAEGSLGLLLLCWPQVRTPGGKPGQVVPEMVQLFDTMATMLQLADIEPVHIHFAESLLPMLRGSPGNPMRPAFAEGGFASHEKKLQVPKWVIKKLRKNDSPYGPKKLQEAEHPLSVCRAIMMKTMEWKFVYRTDPQRPEGHNELYNVKEDPRELKNLYYEPGYEALRAEQLVKVMNWLMVTCDVTPQKEDGRGFQRYVRSRLKYPEAKPKKVKGKHNFIEDDSDRSDPEDQTAL